MATVSKSVSSSAAAPNTEYTRLHITPLDASLLSVVIPSSVIPHARNISYHTIETFPEKQYGFVDLPTAEADKIKTKLNGATLRGTKMRIEKAKPEAIPQPTKDGESSTTKKEKKKKSKKRKREAGLVDGVELEDRKVKRGWTTTEQEMIEGKRKSKKDKGKEKRSSKDEKKDKKKKKKELKSKYTDRPECLFKTKLPEPAATQSDDVTAEHKKKKRKGDREVVIHEFEKTTKYPSFLKSTTDGAKPEAVTFEDGVGWVDSKGDVVDAVRATRHSTQIVKADVAEPKSSAPAPVAEDDTTSSSGTSSDESSDEDEDEDKDAGQDDQDKKGKTAEATTPAKKLKVQTEVLASPGPSSAAKLESARPKSSSSITSLTIKIPPVTPSATKVHPLEALYKRPKGDDATTPGAARDPQPFSFFDSEDIDDDDDAAEPQTRPPMTPYTAQDFEFRNVRSAAPTPDTAHPSRTFNLWSRQDEKEEKEENEENEEEGEENVNMGNTAVSQAATSGEASQTQASDFQKQFWEKRGDLNRAWRKRKKTAAKEKRYRENRTRADRAI
ncbi:hypothetical protein F4778DRAFT_510664 [Xylariomycetidae sp. FL2044]|nr:hypothetical protein F4778DRAFT_510664 [Xylariomycetidae sp. FL2044]